MHELALLVHASQQLPALVTSVPPVPSPQSPLEQQCYPEARGLEPGDSNRDPGEGGARKEGGTMCICMYAKIERLCRTLVETEINIKLALDQKLRDT